MRPRKVFLVFTALAVASLALPGCQETSELPKNETAAYLFLRAASDENRRLRARTGAYAGSIEDLSSSMPDRFLRSRSAYQFRYQVERDSFAIYAAPKKYRTTGVRSFFVDQTGVVRFELGGSAGASSTPVANR
jgi:hypothetical protein